MQPPTFVHPITVGPATGAAIAIKDCIDVAGTPTRAGSRTREAAAPAPTHAQVVEQLLAAGWRVTGKTGMHELAFGTTGLNAWTGTPVNPQWPDRIPGGSSSGSAAAVAAGVVKAALGTDTGGSIRIPAACCGVVGIKPTFGRVSRHGVLPRDSSLDCVGPLADTVATAVQVMQTLCPDFGPLPPLPDRLTLGLLDVSADASTLAAVTRALRSSGQRVVPVRLPLFDAAYEAGLQIIQHEALNAWGPLRDDPRLGDDVRQRLDHAARSDSAVALKAARALREAFRLEVETLLTTCDAIVLPTLPSPPPRLADVVDASAVASSRLVRPFNVSGHPAVSLPLCDAQGLPVGLQVVARLGQDEHLCAIALRLSRLSPPERLKEFSA